MTPVQAGYFALAMSYAAEAMRQLESQKESLRGGAVFSGYCAEQALSSLRELLDSLPPADRALVSAEFERIDREPNEVPAYPGVARFPARPAAAEASDGGKPE